MHSLVEVVKVKVLGLVSPQETNNDLRIAVKYVSDASNVANRKRGWRLALRVKHATTISYHFLLSFHLSAVIQTFERLDVGRLGPRDRFVDTR